MKKTFVILAFIGLSVVLHAQKITENIKTTWSEEGRMDKDMAFFVLEPIGYDSTGVYGLTHPFTVQGGFVIGPGQKYAVTHISPDLDFVPMEEINLKVGDVDKDFEFALWLNGEYYIFSSFQNQKLKKTFLFAQTLNKETLQVNHDLEKIAEIDYSEFNKFKKSNYYYSLSPDSTKLMIRHSLLNKDNEVLNMGLSVFTSSLELLWQTGHVTPANNNIFTFEEYAVNNQGEVFVLGKSFETEKRYKNHREYKKVRKFPFGGYHRLIEYPDYTYVLIAITEKGKIKQDFTLGLPGQFVRKLTMQPDDKGKVICAGFFAGENSYSVTGNCTFNIDVKKGKVESNHDTFSVDFLTQCLDSKEVKKHNKKYNKKKEFDHYFHFTKPLVFRSDGGFYLMAEQVEQRREKIQSGNTITIFDAYNYDDILVISVDKNGNTEWKQKIDRSTYVVGDNVIFSSFMVHPQDDDLYLLFEEVDEKSTNFFGVIKRSKATLAKFESNGAVTSEIISSAEENGVALLPKYGGYSGSNSLLLLGKDAGRKFKFLNIDISNN